MDKTPTELVGRLRDDQRDRWQRGDRVLVETYLEQCPALQDDPEGILYLLGNEMFLRERHGDPPRLDDYCRRFPQLAVELALQFEVHNALEEGEFPSTLPGLLLPPLPREPDGGSRSMSTGERPIIPGYEILDELGRGGMGVVYLARHLRLDRLVALKVILTGAGAGPELLARFRSEAAAVARLQHPNIVQIYEVGDWQPEGAPQPLPYFALEYVSGGSLDRQLAGTPQPARAAAQLVATLAQAIHYAHQCGILHRDLKPANILLARIEDRGSRIEEGKPSEWHCLTSVNHSATVDGAYSYTLSIQNVTFAVISTQPTIW